MTSSTEKKNPPNGTTTSGFESVRAACDANDIESFGYEDDDEPLPGSMPRTQRKDAEECVVDAALAAAIPPEVRKRASESQIMVAVIRVPGAEWVKPVERRLDRLLGSRWFTFARDGSNRSRDKATEGNGEVASLIAKNRCVAGVAPLPSILPSSLIAAADFTIVVGAPDAAVIACAITQYLGEQVDVPAEPPAVGLTLPDIVSAFREGSTAHQILDRLRSASSRRSSPREDTALPRLATAVEYGEAQRWALAAVDDYREYCAGRLAWSEVGHSAIFFGAPGLGKTFLARILAQELGVPLIATSIADLFSTSAGYLDSVIKATNEVYQRAESIGDCVIFWDECEALPSRQGLDSRHASWWTPVIANFLILLDSAASKSRAGVFLIAATNLIGNVDPALRRPGRFDRSIEIVPPDAAGVVSIVRHQLGGELADVDLAPIGDLAANATAAELMEIVRSGRRAARQARRAMALQDLIDAIVPPTDMRPEDLWRITVHETGHIVLALVVGGNDVVSAAIGGREGAHGHTLLRRTEQFETRAIVEAHAATALGGRAAELVIIGDCCSNGGGGEDSDLHKATELIAALHFSEGLGDHLAYLASSQNVLPIVARDPSLRAVVERHLRQIQDRAIDVVTEHRAAVIAIAEALAERRHLTGDEVRRIFSAAMVAAPKIEHLKSEIGGC